MTMMLASLCCCTPPCGDGCVTTPMLMTAAYSLTDENDVAVCTGEFSDVLRFDVALSHPTILWRCIWTNRLAHIDEWDVFPQGPSCYGTCELPYMQWALGFGNLSGAGVSVRVVVDGVVYNCISPPLSGQQVDLGGCPLTTTGIFHNSQAVFDCSGGGQIGTTFANSGTWEIDL